MSKDVNLGEPTPSGPLPPLPPQTPIELRTLFDIAKIVIFVVIWYVAVDANRALQGAVDFAKLSETAKPADTWFFGVSTIPAVTWLGAKIGLLQGLIVAVQALVTVWAGPTLFLYLGPVLTTAFQVPIKLLGDFSRAWRGSTVDPKKGNDDKPGGKDGDTNKTSG